MSDQKQRIADCDHSSVHTMECIEGVVNDETYDLYFAVCLQCYVLLVEKGAGCSCHRGSPQEYWEPVNVESFMHWRDMKQYCKSDEESCDRFEEALKIAKEHEFTLLLKDGSPMIEHMK